MSMMQGKYSSAAGGLVPVKVDANGQVYVLLASTIAGEDVVNDYLKTKKEAVAVYAPAKTAGTAVAGAYDLVLGSVAVLAYPNFTISVLNVEGGSGNVIDSIRIQASPDNTNWGTVFEVTALAISAASGVQFTAFANHSYRYIRAHCACAAGDTTVDAWITANVG